MNLTQDDLKRLLHYNPKTGIFTWKVRLAPRIKIGSNAGSFDLSTGYIRIRANKQQYYAHRLAFLYIEGYLPENEVDHINRIRNDNRWCNLREVHHLCNMRNRKVGKNNTSGVSGITWSSQYKKWKSQIIHDNKVIFLGYFVDIIDAVKVRWEAEKKYDFLDCCTTSSAYLYLKEHGVLSEKGADNVKHKK